MNNTDQSESSSHSVTALIKQLKDKGDDAAAEELWKKYFMRLTAAVKQKISGLRAPVEDEHDIANVAFYKLCEGAKNGRFSELDNRDDLWRLLMHIAGQNALDTKKRILAQKRGGGMVKGESVFDGGSKAGGFENVSIQEPTVEELVEIGELIQKFLESLPREEVKKVVLLRMEGFKVEEIAEQLGISKSGVERKLRLVRDFWSRLDH